MNTISIDKSTLLFLGRLSRNNNREWFAENKAEYERSHANMIDFAEDVLHRLRVHDHIETVSGKKSLYRIYRDVRFSKNKAPYKNNFGGGFRRATDSLRGGYYFQIQPGNSFVAGGFWGPNKEDLKTIRDDISADPAELRNILKSPSFVKTFGELKGDQVKTVPRGYSKEDPALDLIRKKQFILTRGFSDNEVLTEDFSIKIVDTFVQLRPFFDYMSAVLTTDQNGVPRVSHSM